MILRIDGAAFCSWNKTPDNQLKKRKEILSCSGQRHCLAMVVWSSQKQKAEREDGGRCCDFINSFKPTRCWSETFHVFQSVLAPIFIPWTFEKYVCNLYLVEGWDRILLNVLQCSLLNGLVVPVSFPVFHTDQLELNHMVISKIIVMYWCGIGRSFQMATLLIFNGICWSETLLEILVL